MIVSDDERLERPGRGSRPPMGLTLSPEALAGIVAHARAALPNEACGYLGEKDGVASRVVRLTNADASPVHFRLIPTEQFAAVRALRAEGFVLRAIYHSHPASPAVMSAEDLRLAADPGLSYVIVSLAAAEPVVKSFRVDGEAGEERLRIAGE